MVVGGNIVGAGVGLVGAHSTESEAPQTSLQASITNDRMIKFSPSAFLNIFKSHNYGREMEEKEKEKLNKNRTDGKKNPNKGYLHMNENKVSTTNMDFIDEISDGPHSPLKIVQKYSKSYTERKNNDDDDEIQTNLIDGPLIVEKRYSTTEENSERPLSRLSKRDDNNFNDKIKKIKENLFNTCEPIIVFTTRSECPSWGKLDEKIKNKVEKNLQSILTKPISFPKKINALEINKIPVDRSKRNNRRFEILFYANDEERKLNMKKQNQRYSRASNFLQYPEEFELMRITDIEPNLITHSGDLAKTLKNFSERNEFQITSMLKNCNHIRDMRIYKLGYGVVPRKYKRVIKYLIYYFTRELNNKIAKREGITLDNLPIFEDGELEIMVYLYWQLECTDLLNWDPSKKCKKLKDLLLYCVNDLNTNFKYKSEEHKKCACRNDRTKECVNKKKLEKWKDDLEAINNTIDHRSTSISGECLFILKESVKTIFALATMIKTWDYFFQSCNIHHYMFRHTISTVYEKIKQVTNILKIDDVCENNDPEKSILIHLLENSEKGTRMRKSLINNQMIGDMFEKWLKRKTNVRLLTELGIAIDNHMFCIIKVFTMGFSQKMIQDRMTQDDVLQYLSPYLTYFKGEYIPLPTSESLIMDLKKVIMISLDHEQKEIVNKNLNIWDEAIFILLSIIWLTISRALSSRFAHYRNDSVQYTDKMFVKNVIYDLQNYIHTMFSDDSKIYSWSCLNFDKDDGNSKQIDRDWIPSNEEEEEEEEDDDDDHSDDNDDDFEAEEDDEVLILEQDENLYRNDRDKEVHINKSRQMKQDVEMGGSKRIFNFDNHKDDDDDDDVIILNTISPMKKRKLVTQSDKRFSYHSTVKETDSREWCALCMQAYSTRTICFEEIRIFVCKKCINTLNNYGDWYEQFVKLVLQRLKDIRWTGYPILFRIVKSDDLRTVTRNLIGDSEMKDMKFTRKKRSVIV